MSGKIIINKNTSCWGDPEKMKELLKLSFLFPEVLFIWKHMPKTRTDKVIYVVSKVVSSTTPEGLRKKCVPSTVGFIHQEV